MSVEENNCDEFLPIQTSLFFERTIYPISFTTEKPIVDGIAYAEDGEARKAYREKLQDEEDTQRMKAHDNFVRTVQATYEKEKDNYSSVAGIILQNDHGRKTAISCFVRYE